MDFIKITASASYYPRIKSDLCLKKNKHKQTNQNQKTNNFEFKVWPKIPRT